MSDLENSPANHPVTPDIADPLALGESVGVCVVDVSSQQVVFQNRICKEVCGRQENGICASRSFRFCREHGVASTLREGMRLSSREETVDGACYDVLAMADSHFEAIRFFPMAERLRKQEAQFADSDLTAQQREVVRAVLRGRSNSRICKGLAISENTLRTHLKNIYRKISPEGKSVLTRARKTFTPSG